ncbi:speckle-type POZ protein-like [Chironomus tepperi]|uniref:speckle-type POZ protein-like n=1 Tax=Chironomus tepperi TaxID=113505 RepID=UPI00391F6212
MFSNVKENQKRLQRDFKDIKSWGWPLISLSELFDNSDKYLKNGTLTIGAKIEVLKTAPANLNGKFKVECQHLAIYKDYFETKLYSDLTFVCSDNIEIKAHRFALAPASPILRKLIDIEPSSIIKINDIDGENLTEIFRYIYTKGVVGIDQFAPKLIYGAEKYGLDELKKVCVLTMIKNLSVKNVVDYFLLADQHGIEDLLDRCIVFIKEHQVLVEDEEIWMRLDYNHLKMILTHYQKNPVSILKLESSF